MSQTKAQLFDVSVEGPTALKNGAFDVTLGAGGNVTISDGNLVVADGHGIDFSATADATGMSSELLDDYEEGTWTPIYEPQTGSFTSVTYDSLTFGRYTKIGRLCHAWGFIRTDAITVGTAADSVFIGGFPITAKSGSGQGCVGSITTVNAWAGEDPWSMRMDSSTGVRAHLYYRTGITSNDSATQVTDLGLGTDDNRVYFTISYETV